MTTVITDLPARLRRRPAQPRVRRPLAAAPDAGARARTLPPVHLVLIVTVGVLNVVGLMMVLSASTVIAIEDYGSPWYVFGRQALWAAIGVAVFAFVARVPLAWFRRWSGLLLAGAVIGLLAVLFTAPVDGARRWLTAGPISVQPSELAKLALILFAADVVTRRSKPGARGWYVAAPALCWAGVCGALVMLEPDLDTTIEIGAAVLVVLAVGGLPRKMVFQLLGAAGAGVVALALAAPYRAQRVMAFMHPTANRTGEGYQSYQSLVALGSGRIDGVGLGAGRAKWGLLPNVHTDFIFANVGEELGLLGSLLVLALFVSLAGCGFWIALRALRAGEAHRFGGLVAAGVTSWLTVQTLINLGMVTQLGPVSGTPLPFLSAGGSSLVLCMAAAGLLVNVARKLPPAVAAPVAASRPRRRSRANLSG